MIFKLDMPNPSSCSKRVRARIAWLLTHRIIELMRFSNSFGEMTRGS